MKHQYKRGFYLIFLLLINVLFANAQRKWGKEDLSVYRKDAPFVAVLVEDIPASLRGKVIRSFGTNGAIIAQNDLHRLTNFTGTVYTASNTFKLSPALWHRWEELKEQPFTGIIQLLSDAAQESAVFDEADFEWVYPAKKVAKITAYKSLKALVENPNIVYIDGVKPIEAEGYNGWADLSIHGITNFRKQFSLAEVPLVSLREGMVGADEIDLQGQLVLHGNQPVTVTEHASQMAILVAGSGNTGFNALGAVPGAKFILEPMNSFFPLMNALHPSPLQLNSYGSDLEWFYSIEAQAYDEYIKNHHTLFIFSSGNSGVLSPHDGTYKNIPGFSNLTGAFKQAKNNLLVGGLAFHYDVVNYASAGPTFDGRVKPELVTIADNGTSSSAAVAAGIATGLYATLPPDLHRNDLAKAILIASADDVYTAGIDFKTGYGLINADRALQLSKNEHYIIGNVVPGATAAHNITVPAGEYTVRIALVWNDIAAPVNAATALVNDLDFYLQKNGNQVYPWVLSTAANIDSLNAVAQRKKDELNVVELITDTLNGGTYQLIVDGSKLIEKQPYAIAYQLLPVNRFEFIHPVKDDIIQEGLNQYIRWSTDLIQKGKLFYKNVMTAEGEWIEIDSVRTERPIAMFSNFTEAARYVLKLETDQTVYYSDSFWVMPKVNLRQQYLCDGEGLFKIFTTINSPLTYHLQQFDQSSAQWKTVGSSAEPLLTQNIDGDYWWRAGVRLNEQWLSPTQAITVKSNEDLCFQGTLLVDKMNENVLLNFQTWALHYVDQVEFEKIINREWVSIHRMNQITIGDHTYFDQQLTYGSNVYRAKITLKNGRVVYLPQQSVVNMSDKDVWVYPNPARAGQKIEVVVKEPQKMRLFLYSNDGRLIKEVQVNDTNTVIATERLLPGVYFLTMVYETKLTTVKKIIIQ
jgi:hypothetical protein